MAFVVILFHTEDDGGRFCRRTSIFMDELADDAVDGKEEVKIGRLKSLDDRFTEGS